MNNIQYTISGATIEEELENLVTHIAGDVYDEDADDNRPPDALIEASLVDVATAAEYDDAPLKEVFWRGSYELRDVYDTFYKEESSACQYLTVDLNWNWGIEKEHRNLLLIDQLIVSPAYRGQQLGLRTLYRTIQRFSGDAMLVVLDARPLQCRDNYEISPDLGLDQYTTDCYQATSRLHFYFELLGFRSVANSRYMVLNLDCKRPCIGDFSYPAELEEGTRIN